MFLEIQKLFHMEKRFLLIEKFERGNCEEIRCALNATERPLSNCRTYKANPSRTIYIYWRAFIFY